MKNLIFVSLMILGASIGVASCGGQNEKNATQDATEVSTSNVETQGVKQDTVVLEKNQK